MPDAQTDPKDEPAEKATPPWGDDDSFDAARAWSLIQDLRADKDALTTAKAAALSERDEAVTARDAALAQVAERETERDTSRRDLWVERAVRRHELPDELVEFLTGDDEDAILAKAERLAGLGKAPKGDAKPEPAEKPAAPAEGANQRPEPALKPGHGGDAPAPFDADAIVAAIR